MFKSNRLIRILLISLFVTLIGSTFVYADTIRLITGTGASGRAFQAAATKFQEDTGITVDLIQLPYEETREKILFELSSGSSRLDVVIMDDLIWLADFYSFLEPLEPWIEKTNYDLSQNIDSMVDLFRWTDSAGVRTLYGLPARIGGRTLMYRKDLIETPPRTFEELLEEAKRITAENPDMYGYVASMQQGQDLIADWLPFLRGFGADILSEDMSEVVFNSPEGIAAAQFFVDLYRTHKVVPPGALTYMHDSTILAMQQNLAGMTIAYSPYVLEMNDPEKSRFAGNFATAPYLPYSEASGLSHGVSTLSGWGFGINKFSKKKDLAWEFVKYVASEEVQKYLAVNHSNAPTARAVFDDEEYLALNPDAKAVLEVYSYGKPRPAGKNWAEMEDILASEMSAALSGSKTVEEAFADAERKVKDLIAGQ